MLDRDSSHEEIVRFVRGLNRQQFSSMFREVCKIRDEFLNAADKTDVMRLRAALAEADEALNNVEMAFRSLICAGESDDFVEARMSINEAVVEGAFVGPHVILRDIKALIDQKETNYD